MNNNTNYYPSNYGASSSGTSNHRVFNSEAFNNSGASNPAPQIPPKLPLPQQDHNLSENLSTSRKETLSSQANPPFIYQLTVSGDKRCRYECYMEVWRCIYCPDQLKSQPSMPFYYDPQCHTCLTEETTPKEKRVQKGQCGCTPPYEQSDADRENDQKRLQRIHDHAVSMEGRVGTRRTEEPHQNWGIMHF